MNQTQLEELSKNYIKSNFKVKNKDITFQDLFNIDDMQLLQDQFSKATGVASIITETDGTPITKPSNFTNLCQMIRKTDKGCENCYKSDASIGRFNANEPTIQPCLSGGLWDAGAAISVGGKHIANWLIGQVRDSSQSEDMIRVYANKIQLNEEDAISAFHKVPAMTYKHFQEISKVLFTLANQLSTIAYRNILHSQNIKDLNKSQKNIKKLNENLKTVNTELETIIQEAPNPIILHEEGGNILMLNKAWMRSSGFSLEETPNIDGWIDRVYEDKKTMQSVKKHIHSLYKINEKVDEGEFSFFNKNKELVTWQFSSAPLGVKKGKRIIISSAMDITELKEKDKMLTIKSRQAIMGELIEMIAHQWRQPLSIISTISTSVKFKYEIDDLKGEDVQNGMQQITDAVEHLSKTVDEFRDFLKVKTEKSEFSIDNTFRKIFELIGHQFIIEDIIIKKNIENISLFGFENRLMHVIINILNNAKDEFINKNQDKKIIFIDADVKDNIFEIVIKDNAGGIPPHVINNIFKFHFTTKEDFGGTGVGLYMSKMIMEKHMRGTLEASNVNFRYSNNAYTGAEFKISLPCLK